MAAWPEVSYGERMKLRHLFVCAAVGAVSIACGSSSDSTRPTSDQIIGTWHRAETNSATGGNEEHKVYLVIKADSTHEWLGRRSATTAGTTTSIDFPCGSGKWVLANGKLTLTTEYVTRTTNSGAAPTEKRETREETSTVEVIGNTLRFDGSKIYEASTKDPPAEYCQ